MPIIYICDDEPKILSDIENTVKNLVSGCCVKTFLSTVQLISALQSISCDILLLDIDMPEISGLDVAKELLNMPKKPLLIFVTSHDELVYDSLHYHPFGFIRKRYFNQEINKILSDCMAEIAENECFYSFKCAEGSVRLPLSLIFFFEADCNYLRLHTPEKEYRIRDTVSSVEEKLSGSGFVRVHKGFLVNQSAVEMLCSDEVKLNNGYTVPIGKGYASDAKKHLLRYMMK